jgi:molecular chaperone DnaJ
LSDPQKRAAYDQYGHAAFDPRQRARGGGFGGGFHDPFDIFREVFGGAAAAAFLKIFSAAARTRRNRSAATICVTIWKSRSKKPRSAAKRKFPSPSSTNAKRATVPARKHGSKLKTCATCGGRGQVLMSRGIFSIAQTCPQCKGAGRILEKPCKTCHGERQARTQFKNQIAHSAGRGCRFALRSSGNGEAGFRGGPPGDLYVVLHVKAHEIFQRDGDDLLCEVPVSFIQAALGAEIEVPTLEGKIDDQNSRRHATRARHSASKARA